MPCERYVQEIADAAAADGPGPELEAHLEHCPPCAAEFRAQREVLGRLDDELAALIGQDPSPNLQARIRDVVSEEDRGRTLWARRAFWALAAATLLMAFWILTPRGARSPGPIPDTEPRLADVQLSPRPDPTPPRRSSPRASPPASPMPSRRTSAISRVDAPPEAPASTIQGGLGAPDVLVPDCSDALALYIEDLEDRILPSDSLLVAELDVPLVAPRPLHIVTLELVTPDTAFASAP